MRRDRNLVALGHRRDLLRLAQPTAPADVEHRDRGRLLLEHLAERPTRRQRFAGRGPDPRRLAECLQRIDIRRADRILEPVRLERLHRARDFHRGRQIPQTVHLDKEIDLVADPLANLLEWGHALLQVSGRDIVAAGRIGRMVERPDLHAGIALGDQALGEVVGAIEERVEILVRSFILFEAPVVGAPVRPCPNVAVAGTGVVDANPVAAFASEQLIEGHAGGLPHDVPERDVERRGAADLRTGRFESDIVLHELARMLLDPERILAEHLRRERFMDIRMNRLRTEEGLSQPDMPGIGGDLDPDDVGKLGQADRFDLGDFHGGCPFFRNIRQMYTPFIPPAG